MFRSLAAALGGIYTTRPSDWNGSNAAPAALGDYDDVPCSPIDAVFCNLTVTYGLVFTEKLDASKVEAAAWEVVDKRIRKLGARLASKDGVFVYRIPREYSNAVPPVRFTSSSLPQRLPPIPCVSKSPTCHSTPSTYTESLFRHESCPKCFDGFLQPNTPSVHLHLTTFSDGSCLGLTASHFACDAQGAGIILGAIASALTRGIESVPAMPWDTPHPYSDSRWFMKGEAIPDAMVKPSAWGWFRFMAGFLWRRWHDPQIEGKVVVVPKPWLAEQKKRVANELKAAGAAHWISSSDVLMAWWYKTVLAHRVHDRSPITVSAAMDLRPRLPSFFPSAYIHNAVYPFSLPPSTALAFASSSLANLALLFRSVLQNLTTEPSRIQQGIAWVLSHPDEGTLRSLPHGVPENFTSWRAVGFGGLDFSGARADGSQQPSGQKPKPCRAAMLATFVTPAVFDSATALTFEDDEAIWLFAQRGSKDWERIRRGGQLAFS